MKRKFSSKVYADTVIRCGMPKGTNEVGSPPVLTDRGYVQVLASRRGMGRSEGVSGGFFHNRVPIECKYRADRQACDDLWSLCQEQIAGIRTP